MVQIYDNEQYYSSGIGGLYNPLLIERIKLKGMEPHKHHFVLITINEGEACVGILFTYARLDDGGYSINVDSFLFCYRYDREEFDRLTEPLIGLATS